MSAGTRVTTQVTSPRGSDKKLIRTKFQIPWRAAPWG